jgi:thiamine-monophosphate kinase
LLISVSAVGIGEPDSITYRNGAREGDLLVVSGDLGAAYLGYQILRREKEIFLANPQHEPDLDRYTYLAERQLKPEARRDITELLKQLQVQPTAMIDISDGLSSEILHLSTQSELGCQIYEDKIPMDPTVITTAEEFGLHPATCALNGGEDYELLFTIDPGNYNKIKGNPNLSVIGHMTSREQGVHMVTKAGEQLPLQAQGWNAMSSKSED